MKNYKKKRIRFFSSTTAIITMSALAVVSCSKKDDAIEKTKSILTKITKSNLKKFEFKEKEITLKDLTSDTAKEMGITFPKLPAGVNVKVNKPKDTLTVEYKIYFNSDLPKTLTVRMDEFKYWLEPFEVVSQIINKLDLRMPKNGPDLASEGSTEAIPKHLTEKGYQNIRTYTNGINLNTPKLKVKLTDTQEYEFDFTKVFVQIQAIRDLLNQNDYNYFTSTPLPVSLDKIGNKNGPVIAATTAYMLGITNSTKMTPFLDLIERDDFGDTEDEQINNIYNHHPYIKMLEEYHNVFWTFVKTPAYKEWIKGQSFNLYKNGNNDEGIPEATIVKDGEYFDAPNNINDWLITPAKQNEVSNFEALFGAYLINIQDLIAKKLS